MKFSALQEISLQDYPCKISTIVWVSGCNKKCWWCSNPKFVKKNLFDKISEDYVINFINNKNKKQIWIDAITICGGEPTIQKGLLEFLNKIRINLPDLLIKIDTNGTQPEILKKIINEKLVDYIAMDVKFDEFLNSDYLKSIQIVNDFIKQKNGEFRLTLYPGCLENIYKEKLKEIFKDCESLYLQRFSREMKLLKDNKKREYTYQEIKDFYEELKQEMKGVKKRW